MAQLWAGAVLLAQWVLGPPLVKFQSSCTKQSPPAARSIRERLQSMAFAQPSPPAEEERTSERLVQMYTFLSAHSQGRN